jgi:NADH-quinone oxidoreductase subunit C
VTTDAFGTVTSDIAAAEWASTAAGLRADGYDFFDWLSAYDDGPAGIAVVMRVMSAVDHRAILLRTRVDREAGRLPTLTPVWPGAAWHERETTEMFGIEFEGHPDPRPLLLPEGFQGHPLRKEFVLASRAAKEWPGAKEPGESVAGRKRPLGVPKSGEWSS